MRGAEVTKAASVTGGRPLPSLDIGCGGQKDADVGMDLYPAPGVDVVHNVTAVPWPFPDGSFSRVVAHQVFEHIPPPAGDGPDPLFTICNEVHRVLVAGGLFEFDVPHCWSPGAFSNIFHRRAFHESAFTWLWSPDYHPRFAATNLPWERLEVRVTRQFRGYWHLRKYLPGAYRLLCRARWGRPDNIYVRLRKIDRPPPPASLPPSVGRSTGPPRQTPPEG